jgi:hypothetical protein
VASSRGGFSFADGHSEIRKWRDSRTMPAVVPQGFVNDWLLSPDNQTSPGSSTGDAQ